MFNHKLQNKLENKSKAGGIRQSRVSAGKFEPFDCVFVVAMEVVSVSLGLQGLWVNWTLSSSQALGVCLSYSLDVEFAG